MVYDQTYTIPAPGSPAVRPDGRPIGETVLDFAGDLIRQAGAAGKVIMQHRVSEWAQRHTDADNPEPPAASRPTTGLAIPAPVAAVGIGGVALRGLGAVALIAVLR